MVDIKDVKQVTDNAHESINSKTLDEAFGEMRGLTKEEAEIYMNHIRRIRRPNP